MSAPPTSLPGNRQRGWVSRQPHPPSGPLFPVKWKEGPAARPDELAHRKSTVRRGHSTATWRCFFGRKR